MTSPKARQKERSEPDRPVSLAVIVFVLAILLLFGGLGLGMVLYRVGGAMAQLQRQALTNEASAMAMSLTNFLEDHLIVLKNQAASPILKEAVTNSLPPGQDRVLADYVNNLALVGAQAAYYVLDGRGRILHASMPMTRLPAGTPSWVHEILTGRRSGYIGVYSRDDEHFWHLAAPILVGGAPRGILAAQLPLDLGHLVGRELPASGRILTLFQDGRRLASLGQPLDHSLSRSESLPGLRLTMVYEIDAAPVGRYRNRILLEVVLLLVVLGGLCIVLFQRVGRRLFVLPHQRLVATRAQLEAANSELEREVAERRSAEASLKLYESAVKQARESIIITDADLDEPGPRIVLVNPAFTEMTGYSAAEVLGRTPRILQGPATDPQVTSNLRQSLQETGEFHGETINYRKDGSQFYIEWHIAPIMNSDDQITHFVAIQRDVTERVLAAKRLSDAEARYRSVVDSISEVIFQTDTKGRWTFLNPAWSDITGYSVEESLGRDFLDFVPEEDRADLAERMSGLTRGKTESLRLELRYLTKTGKVRWMEATTRLLPDEAGGWLGATGTLNDITERRRAEQALAHAREREVAIGARIQKTLLLGSPPMSARGMAVGALSVASQRIDGDFYDFLSHGPQVLDVVIGDVMGKGVPAALLGAAAKSYFPRAFSELVSLGKSGALPRPERVVDEVHRHLTPDLIKLESFVTLCYARFNQRLGLMSFVDCGHTRLIHHSPALGRTEKISGANMPLGFDLDEAYREENIGLSAGDVFVFYSDGVTEATSPDGRFFGEDLLADCVRRHHDLPPGELVDKIRGAVLEFRGSDRLADDLTCLAVKVAKGRPEPLELVKKRFHGGLKDLATVRREVEGLCTRQKKATGVDRAGREQLILAVNEAASNIVKHAHKGKPEQSWTMSVEAHSDRLEVRLCHGGPAFHPAQAPPPKFDGSKESGFGLYLIKECVDLFLTYRDPDGRQCLLLVKYGKA